MLMDEPFGALDAFSRDEMNLLLLRLWAESGKTIAFVTHNIGEAIFLADRVVVMTARPGQIRDLMPVKLTRPRPAEVIATPEFMALKARVLAQVREESGRAWIEPRP